MTGQRGRFSGGFRRRNPDGDDAVDVGNNGFKNDSTTDDRSNLASDSSSWSGNRRRREETDLDRYFYNSKTGELLGRSGGSWAKLCCFSLCFIASLACVFGLFLWVFYQTLDNYTPRLQLGSSFIGGNPGLGFRPMRVADDPYSSLIWFKHGGAGDWDELKANLDAFLAEYEPGYWANAGASQTKCHWERGPLSKQEACEFNKEWLSDQNSDIKCISEEQYGYFHGKPCILIKLNRIYGWRPEPFYNISEVEEHPEMPQDLKRHIRSVWDAECRGRRFQDECPKMNMTWLHCDGEDDPDKENIGSLSYTPWRGFPTYFFPYWNQLGYLQPIVMVQLKNPTPGVLVNVQCTAWSRGMRHDLKRRVGSVHLEFLMD